MAMDRFHILEAPSSAYYIPNFITKCEEENLLSEIYNSPKPKWTQLSHRRLQNWGGIPHINGMIAEDTPPWLDEYFARINTLNLMTGNKVNHALINEYLPGQGIMPHFDGDLYFPTITTISLGSHTVLKFLNPETNWKHKFLLEPRSLLVLQDDLFSKYLHSIEDVRSDILDSSIKNLGYCSKAYTLGETLYRNTRISVTIRHVPKTSKFKLNVGLRF